MKYRISKHRLSHFAPRQLGLAFLAVSIIPGLLQAAPPNLRGSLGIHDPSTIITCNGRYYVFGTGGGIGSKSSADTQYWVTGPSVFTTAPSWTAGYTGSSLNGFWAPEIIYFNGLYHLYYAVSTFGVNTSAIGLATNPTLDPSNSSYLWTDQGAVIASTTSSYYNCIDPSVTFDSSSNLWMSFGSFWNGIYLVQLDATTGLLNTTNTTLTHLALNTASGDPIEASYLYPYGGYYYLFVNWGTCCNNPWMTDTYKIRVGRSTTGITGPYYDRNGNNMASGGGTLFLKTTGKYTAPGQVGILNENGNYYFGYHYLDANDNGVPTFDIEPLYWTPDGWPAFTNDWAAVYRFQFGGRDDNNEYYGLLQNGAYVHYDPLLGNVLVFNGTNQYVNLPDGAGNGRTVSTVFKWNGGPNWEHVFDFGQGTTTNGFAFLTPQATNGYPQFAITSSNLANAKVLNGTAAVPAGVWTHVAVTTDGTRGILYVNGSPVATNSSMTLTVPDIVPTSVWFGRSTFTTNPFFSGQISSVRIYGRALAANEIVAPVPSITAPLAGSAYQPGNTLSFAGNATDFADTPLSVTGLTWTVEFHDTGVTNIVFGPVTGAGGGSFTIPSSGEEATNGFHRVVLVATDTLGRMATNDVDIYPGPANWTAFYPFDNGAVDANGFFSGSLVNGATTSTDSIRGSVLNLSGASQYVSLPAGVGALRTFAAWVKWGGGSAWQRIFDFGVNNTSYAMLTAKANSGELRFEITPNGSAETRDLDSPNPLPVNVWTHVAVTLDGRQAVMYINGHAVAVNSSVNLLPSDVAGTANYLGRSQFTADPYFSGQMDSVQISSQTLPIEQITASSIGLSHPASTLTLNWPAWTNGLVLGSATNLGSGAVWTTVASPPFATNGINFLTLAPTNNQMFFRLQLP